MVKPDPRCSWQGHSRRVGADVGDKSTGSRVVRPLRIIDDPPRIPLFCGSKKTKGHEFKFLLLGVQFRERSQFSLTLSISDTCLTPSWCLSLISVLFHLCL